MKRNSENLKLVSVVIACYNAENYIEETIHSVLKQSYQNFEIVIVDDGSSDNSLDIIKKISEKEHRIKYYSIDHSGRASVPRNYGVKKASGKLIAFLDADDLWTKDKLKYQLNVFNEHPDIGFVYSMCFTFGEVNFFSEHYELLPLPFRASKNYSELRTKGNSIPLSSVLIKKELFESVGGFDEDAEFKAVEDYDLWLRVSEKSSFILIPRVHVYYRIHDTQSSADWETREKRLQLLAEKRNINLPPYKMMRRKGRFVLLIRNTIHLYFYLLYKLIGYLDNGDRL
jgi:glycosyltransferase involved in cell wall biosynthesis